MGNVDEEFEFNEFAPHSLSLFRVIPISQKSSEINIQIMEKQIFPSYCDNLLVCVFFLNIHLSNRFYTLFYSVWSFSHM